MKTKITILLFCCAFIIKAQQNLVMNGSFEDYSSTYPIGEIISNNADFNSKMNNLTAFSYQDAFGNGNYLVIFNDTSQWMHQYGLLSWDGASEGEHYLYINGSIIGNDQPMDKFSLDLFQTGVISGNTYTLMVDLKQTSSSPHPSFIEQPTIFLDVGLSNYATNFGTFLHQLTPPVDDNWETQVYHFVAPTDADYLTISAVPDMGNCSNLIDNVRLYSGYVSAVEEHTPKKQLLRIVDVLGRETNPKKDTPLFYIYSDGSVEKKIIIE